MGHGRWIVDRGINLVFLYSFFGCMSYQIDNYEAFFMNVNCLTEFCISYFTKFINLSKYNLPQVIQNSLGCFVIVVVCHTCSKSGTCAIVKR